MNLMEYVQELIQNGTWGKLDGDAHSILIYILAKSKGEPVKVVYSKLSKELGISVNTLKKHFKILVAEGLLIHNQEEGTYKPTVELDSQDTSIPIPPTTPGEQPSEDLDLFEWIQNFMSSPLGAFVGVAVIGYLIKLWVNWVESQSQVDDPFADWNTFYKEKSYKDLKLDECLKLLENYEF